MNRLWRAYSHDANQTKGRSAGCPVGQPSIGLRVRDLIKLEGDPIRIPLPYALRRLTRAKRPQWSVVVVTAVVLVTVVAAVTVAVAPTGLVVGTAVSVAISCLALDSDFQTPDPVFHVVVLPAGEAISGYPMKPIFDIAGFIPQAGSLAIA